MKLAVSHSIPFLSTGGGHSFSIKLGELKNGIELDMSGFTTVSIDTAASTMTIGGGVTIGDVEGPLYAAGKEIRKFSVTPLPAVFVPITLQQLARAPAWGSLERRWELA